MPRTPIKGGSEYFSVVYYDIFGEIMGVRTEEYETLNHAKNAVREDLKKHREWRAEIHKTTCMGHPTPVAHGTIGKRGDALFTDH